MSVTIKLDRPALRGLIEDDSEFKFELSNAVVSEVIRKIFEKDLARLVKEAEPELYTRAVAALQDDTDMEERIKRGLSELLVTRSSWQGMPAMTPAMKTLFDKGIESAKERMEAAVAVILDAYVTEQAQMKIDELLETRDLDTRIAKRVDRMMDEEIEKRVLAHHEALLGKMKAVLG